MNKVMEKYLHNIERYDYDGLVGRREALLEHTSEIGQKQNAGETEGVPTPETCAFLTQYLAQLERAIARKESVMDDLEETFDCIIDVYLDMDSWVDVSLAELLPLATAATFEEFETSPADFLDGLVWDAGERGYKIDPLEDWAAFGRDLLNTRFRMTRVREPETTADSTWYFLMDDIIAHVEESVEHDRLVEQRNRELNAN